MITLTKHSDEVKELRTADPIAISVHLLPHKSEQVRLV
ncbi:hypothetical protein J2Z31_005972 [Sinorhizobium kostiense]|uniref:Transposase n=1 Tax=Sinorhizobium kostiense TaxID=76747 RepID=A0ABS4R947_9HYPH|nr:hypothetical protein [Sinorhizobium kostiense]